MNITRLILRCRQRGAVIRIDSDLLTFEAQDGVITDEMRAGLIEHKDEVIANRQRLRLVCDRITGAILAAEIKFPGKFDWSSETLAAQLARDDIDNAMTRFVSGECGIDEVERTWKAFIRAIET
jgi:tubulysin polyketide synthase-like protein